MTSSTCLLRTVKSILLAPRLVRNVVQQLSSLTMCSCLHSKNSSSVLPLLLVSTSRHEVDLELLSIAKMIPTPFACVSVASIFCKSISIGRLISKYMLAIMSVTLSTFISKTTASSSESWVINIVSICLLLMTIAARFLHSPDAKTLKDRGKPTILFPIVYGSCMHKISVPSSSIIFSRLSVANLECCKLICTQLSRVFNFPGLVLCLAIAFCQPAISIQYSVCISL
jgi:hypothetical protein